MELAGEYRLPLGRRQAWAALTDPVVLKNCISGCESVERNGDVFTARIAVRISVVRMAFTGELRLHDVVEAQSCAVTGEGKGGVAGFARGSANIRLQDEGNATLFRYALEAKAGGRLAHYGGRIVENAARRLIDRFFERFVIEVARAPTTATGGTGESAV